MSEETNKCDNCGHESHCNSKCIHCTCDYCECDKCAEE